MSSIFLLNRAWKEDSMTRKSSPALCRSSTNAELYEELEARVECFGELDEGGRYGIVRMIQ